MHTKEVRQGLASDGVHKKKITKEIRCITQQVTSMIFTIVHFQ